MALFDPFVIMASSRNGATMRPYPVNRVVPRSSLAKPSRDRRDAFSKLMKKRLQTQQKRRLTNGKSLASPSNESDNSTTEDTTPARSLARMDSPIIDFDGLSRPSVGTRERREESPEQATARLDRLKGAVRTILECVGEDPNREGLLATPERYAKAMMDFTKGYENNLLDIVNGAIFNERHNEMVIVKDIEICSLCEHHLVPFMGKIHVGYIPNNSVIGLSKLARIAEMFARRLQVQERLTKSVANAIFKVLQPQGVAVVMESNHLCMSMRGVQKPGSTTITSCMLGCFERRSKTRNEFLSLINVNR